MSNTVRLTSDAALTRPASGRTVTCARCGTALATFGTACESCGAAMTAATAAEHAEKVRQRLQEAVGDRYELLELLGRGGMGIVFRAREVALDREVALKVLALDPLLAPEAYERFEREAKLAARLDHPNVVPIFSVGQGASVAYYTMRLVRGGSVEELTAGGRQIDLARCAAILRDVAAALDYAHRQGVVHRDIKPANILLGDGGHASVADFGIAKALGPADGTTATGTGVIGSPGYMSPEQWRGEPVDGRADQYSLAIVAFEMLAGKRPFETVRAQDLLKLHLSAEVPDIGALRPGLDPSVDAAIRRALAKYPSERFPTASAFVDTLAGRRPGAVAEARPARRAASAPDAAADAARASAARERTRGGVATALVATVLLVGVGVAAAALAPPTRPTMLHAWEVVRRSVEGALPGRRAPTAGVRYAATDSGESGGVATPPLAGVQDGVVAPSQDSPARTPSDSGTAGEARTTPPARSAIGLDPALVGHAADMHAAGAPRLLTSRHRDAGFVRVTTRGGSARVRVDGRGYGFTPLVLRLRPGPHTVTVEGAGDAFLPLQVTVDVAAGDTAAAVFTAPGWNRPAPAAESETPAITPPVGPTTAPPPAADSGDAPPRGH